MIEKYKIKVSIITVVYNGIKTIEQTIKSVLQQSYKNIEYIIIDGLSTDGTQSIIEKYKKNIAYFISEKDDGLYDAMNKGISKATGDIIGIINSDDWYVENIIEKIVRYFEQNEVELVYGKIISIAQDGVERLSVQRPLDDIWYCMVTPHPSVFVKKSVYKKFGTFNTAYKISADYDYLLRVYSQNVKFGYLDEVIAYFRCGGISTLRQKEMWDEAYIISMKYINTCSNKEEILSKIKEVYHWNYFTIEITTKKKRLLELLYCYFHDKVKKVIIFGIGIWGKKCYKILKCEEISIMYFSDNNKEKWGINIHEIKVISPQKLINMDAYILIAVKDGWEEIKYELQNMGNHNLKCVSLKELEILYYKLEENIFDEKASSSCNSLLS